MKFSHKCLKNEDKKQKEKPKKHVQNFRKIYIVRRRKDNNALI